MYPLQVLVLLGPALAPPSLACWGLLASLQPSKLPGHVSLRVFETAIWQFWFYWAEPLPHLLRPARAKASLPHSSFPSCLVKCLLEVSKMPFGSFGSTRTSPCPTFFGLLGPPCTTPAFQVALSCIFKGFRNCRLAVLVLLGPALAPALPAFKLPGQVSSSGFVTAVWQLSFY